MDQKFDPYYEWLGIPPADQPPHAYRLLGLTVFESNPKVIDNATEQRMLLLRARQSGKNAAESQRLLNEVASAQRLLLDPQRKAALDTHLKSSMAAASLTPLDPSPLGDPLSGFAPLTSAPLGPGAGFGFSIRSAAPPKRSSQPVGVWIAAGSGAVALIVVALVIFNSQSKPIATTKSQAPPPAAIATVPKTVPLAKDTTTPTIPAPKAKEGTATNSKPASSTEVENAGLSTSTPNDATGKAPPATLKEPGVILPWPSEGERRDALGTVREKMRNEFAEIPSEPLRGSKLATALTIACNQRLNSPAELAAALDEARQLAAAAGNWRLSLQLLDGLQARFALPPHAIEADTYARTIVSPMPTPEKRALLHRLLAHAEHLFEAEENELAGKLLQTMTAEAAKLQDPLLVDQIQARRESHGTGEPRRNKTVPSSIFLDDLDEEFAGVALGILGRHGDTGLIKSAGPPQIRWQNAEPAHALLTHPPASGKAFVLYDLGGAFQQLRGVAGLAPLASGLRAESPLVFRIYGDQQLLWQSSSIQKTDSGESFEVNVRYVHCLRLEVECPGGNRDCHAVWIAPELTGGVYPLITSADRWKRGNEVYLDDLMETEWSVGWGRFCRMGSIGHTITEGPPLVTAQGQRQRRSLIMVPPDNGASYAVYELDKRFTSFSARVGVTVTGGLSRLGPARFVLLGDGKVLWQSPSIDQSDDFHGCKADVTGVDRLRLEVHCDGQKRDVWAVWLDAKLERVPPVAAQANPHTIQADRVVLWNTHNGHIGDQGAAVVNLLAYQGSQLVWQENCLRLPWDGATETTLEVPMPDVRFNRLRTEVTSCAGPLGAGFAEIQVFRGNQNLAPAAIATAAHPWPNAEHDKSFSAHNVNDGVIGPEKHGVGSLIFDRRTHGWVELEWQPPTGKTSPGLNYKLRRHPETAIPFDGHYYLCFRGAQSWDQARARCQEMGGYLVSINSADEQTFLRSLAMKAPTWIGLHAKGDRTWVWMNGVKAKFANWAPGKPSKDNEPFVELDDQGQWKNAAGNADRGYVCEWDF